MSNASSSNAPTDLSSPRKDVRRQSLILANGSISSKADITGSHQHRRSLSKTGFLAGEGVKGHGKRMSRSRASRGSISGFAGVSKAGGHGHTRSRASISISMSSPAPSQQTVEESLDRTPTPSGSARLAGLGAPSSWQQQNAFPMSPEPSRPLSAQLSNLPLRSTSPLPPPPTTGPPPASHGRHGSRHTRRSSVANFRESLEIVSGANQPLPTNLHAAVSSFSAPSAHGTTSPASAASHSPLPGTQSSLPAWSSDPRQVLEALKERGRFEDEGSLSPEQTRQSALEALEGRVSAPSPVISLGNEEPGELLTAPPPTAGTALSPLPPTGFSTSPMIGLGVGVSNKRNSWGPVGGASNVTVVGGQGAMELGGIVEEDEEEEEERRTSTPVSSPRRINSSSSPRKRDSARSKDGSNPSPKRSSIRPLSLSLSSPITSSHSPSNSRSCLAPRASSGPPSPIDERAAHSPGEKRHISVFHSVAASQLGHGLPPSPNLSTGGTTPRGGLRSLSIGNSNSNATSTASLLDRRFPSRSASVGTAATLAQTTPRRPSPLPAVNNKRSSISYRTDGATPPVSRYSFNSSPALVSPTVSTSNYSSFPFGVTGGFGDLEVDDDLASNTSRPTSFIDPQQSAAAEAELASLRTQLEQLELRQTHLVSTHALEINEFERKASEEAGEMRTRISELERQLDDERNARRIELEGLQREVSMAKEAVVDLTDERDSLREDVDGWRSRCNKLETTLKKEREEEALADAQGKLIGEMRDQIYTLVAALERERGEHGETRKEVERMLEERVREAAAEVKQHPHQQQPQRSDSVALDMGMMGMDDDEDDDDEASSLGMGSHYHQSKTTSDASMLSGSSFSHSFSGNTTEDTSIGTDLEDSFSHHKNSSPHSGHSSFNSIPSVFSSSAPNSVRGRDSDVAAALGQLDTLAEEDEEDEEAALGGNSLSHEDRIRLDSAGSQLSSSTTSDVMPRTPDKTSSDHNRSHSFIRHWSVSRSFCPFRLPHTCTDSFSSISTVPQRQHLLVTSLVRRRRFFVLWLQQARFASSSSHLERHPPSLPLSEPRRR